MIPEPLLWRASPAGISVSNGTGACEHARLPAQPLPPGERRLSVRREHSSVYHVFEIVEQEQRACLSPGGFLFSPC